MEKKIVIMSLFHLTALCLLCVSSCTAENSYRLRLEVVSYTSGAEDACIGGDVGLTDTSILLQIRNLLQEEAVSEWTDLIQIDPKIGFNGTLELVNSSLGVQFRLLQLEHGGGSCNCWRVEEAEFISIRANLSVPIGTCFPVTLQPVFCGGLARNARGFVSWVHSFASTFNDTCHPISQLIDKIRTSPSDNCSTVMPKLEISYSLIVDVMPTYCGGPEGLEDAIEFSMRTNTSGVYGPWIPLRLTWKWPDNSQGNYTINTTRVRGYDVETHGVLLTLVTQQVTICGEDFLPTNASEVQFRWMNTADQPGRYDMWAIFNVTVDHFTRNESDVYRILDTETEGFSAWQEVRNGSTTCTGNCRDVLPCRNEYLTFGGFDDAQVTPELHTKIALTKPLQMGILGFHDFTSQPSSTSFSAPTTDGTQPTFRHRQIAEITSFVASEIDNNPTLKAIKTSEPSMALNQLLALVSSEDPPSSAGTLFLLGNILGSLNSTVESQSMAVLQNTLQILDSVPSTAVRIGEEGSDVTGSSLLSLMDRLTSEFPGTEINFTGTNTSIQTRLVSTDTEEYITAINSKDYFSDAPLMSIAIPPELVRKFGVGKGAIRVITTVTYNVQGLFTRGKTGNNSSFLGPGIVSTSLECENYTLCDTTLLNLTDPVIIVIQHSQEVINNQSYTFESECVFWNFLAKDYSSSLTIGEWSTEGCSTSTTLSNASQTVCECNHLTHFAILLSPVPLDFDEKITLSLQAIGYIGITISLVAMTITTLTFIIFNNVLRSLHNMRNYIHIHLCINLMIAQLIFVVGIDKSAEDHVPVHCQAIAVLLHYFFLVSFMWMLIEGVVLYFILIRVFIGNTKKHILGFTLASYGIPLLYMGLTLPLGFALKVKHYGSTSACFLNAETHFIWAFIAPVILIILLNIGFLIMAAVALWRQKSQKGEMDRKSIAAWLKTVGFLVVVMGITWIVGVLVQEVEALFPLAYIFTIMVAFQGVAIFLSLVAFQKPVRDEFIKWWKKHIIQKNKQSSIETHFSSSNPTNKDNSLKAGYQMKKKKQEALPVIASENNSQQL